MFLLKTCKAVNSLLCADVSLRNYWSHSLTDACSVLQPTGSLHVLLCSVHKLTPLRRCCAKVDTGVSTSPPPSTDQKSWLWEAVCLGHGSQLSFKSLTSALSFVWKWTNSWWLFAPNPPPWTLPLDPTGLCPQTPAISSCCALTMLPCGSLRFD